MATFHFTQLMNIELTDVQNFAKNHTNH